MKKKSVYLTIVVFLVAFLCAGIFSCSKKKRLTLSSLVITVSPSSATVLTGATQDFTVTATRDGDPVSVDFTWSVSPSSLGTITDEGKFTAGSSAGTGNVIASAEGESGSAAVEVKEEILIDEFPFYIHKDKDDDNNHYILSKWWDDAADGYFNVTWDCPNTPSGIGNSLKIDYTAGGKGWGEIGWVEPWDNDGTNYPNGGYNLTGAKKLTFWAKCDSAGHEISVQVANFEDATYPDTTPPVKMENINLPTIWTKYEIDLTGKDLSKIQFGFLVTAFTPPYTFYLDEIKFEE